MIPDVRGRACQACIIAVLLATSQTVAARERLYIPEPIFANETQPRSRLRGSLRVVEFNQDGLAERRSTARAMGEIAMLQDRLSLFASVPYTRLDAETGRTEHLDTVSIGARAATEWADANLLPFLGLELGFATGNEDRGIGSKTLGFFAPSLGVGWRYRVFALSLGGRWSSQTNSSFRQTEEELFDRSYVLTGLAALVFESVDLLLEVNRNLTYAPEESRLSTTEVAPGIRFRAGDSLHVSVAVVRSVASEHRFHDGLRANITLFY